MTHIPVATDAWHPQVSGVVRTLTAMAAAARGFGVEVEALQVSRQDRVEFAAAHTWQASARVFVEHALNVRSELPGSEVAEFVAEDPHFAA
jgi:hypothetical protein